MAPSLARGAAPHGTQPRATTSASAWRRWVRRLCLATATFALACVAQADGTRTLHPSGATGNRGVMDVTADSTFAGVAVSRQFLYVYAQAGEVILLGSRNRDNGGNIYVFNPRDFGPRGNEPLLAASDANFTCSTQSGRGSITSRAQELAGPNSADGTATVAGGFNPCWYTAPTTGICSQPSNASSPMSSRRLFTSGISSARSTCFGGRAGSGRGLRLSPAARKSRQAIRSCSETE